MNTILFQLAWWDDHPWPPKVKPHWVKLSHTYESEGEAMRDLEVYHKDYPESAFAVLRVATKLLAQVKGKEEGK